MPSRRFARLSNFLERALVIERAVSSSDCYSNELHVHPSRSWKFVVEKCDEWCGRSVNQCRFCQPNFETWRCLSITSIEHKLQSLVWSKVWKAFHAIFCLCYITHQKNIYPIFVCYIPFYQSFHVLYGRVICHLLVAKQRAFKRLDRKHIGPCNHKSHKNVINPTTDEIPERQTV